MFQPEEVSVLPVQRGLAPWEHYLEFKTGKTQKAFAGVATPDQVGAGFLYYDGEIKEKVSLKNGPFHACIIAVLSGVQGVVKDASDRYTNYYSNLVQDTRTQLLRVHIRGIDRPIATGIYKEIKDNLPLGVGYQTYFIVYIPELDKVMAMSAGGLLSEQVKKAVGAACNLRPDRVSLFNLCDLSTKFWVLKFSGEFQKTNQKGEAYSQSDSEMYFMPQVSSFQIGEKSGEMVAKLQGFVDRVNDYVEQTQARIWAPDPKRPEIDQPAGMAHIEAAPMPSTEPVAADPGDDLPF